jgi:broad specificity phosphatase PhoE
VAVYSPASLLNPLDDFGASPAIGAPILYVVRHAQNDDDAEGRIRGLKDQPLNEQGEKQLKWLRSFFDGKMVLAVITDDLSRTRATAMAVAQACNCGIDTDICLRSWDLGKLEGKSMAAHKLEIQDLKTHPDKVPVAGESWGAFKRKCIESMERLVRKAMESSAPLVIVTHGSWIQIFFEQYADGYESKSYDDTPLDQAGIAALYLTRQGTEVRALKGAKPNRDE